MKQIKIGIVGMGRMGITHYSIINSHPNAQITAVVDLSSMVLSMMKKYIHGINTYHDYHEFFSKEELQAIIIATPPALHYPIAMKAAEQGIHVFSEKPFTTKSVEAKALTTIFEGKNLINQVGYVNRFNDVFRTVKEYVQNGIIGDVIRFKSEMYSRTVTKTEEGNNWRDSHESGGGALFEVASHAIDLVNYIVGKPDKITGSSLTKIFSKQVEDAVNATFLYRNGISGTIYVNWSDESYRKPTNKIEIFGTKGKILADQHSLKLFLKTDLPDHGFREGWNTRFITDVFKPVPFYVRGNEFTAQLYHFIDCITHEDNQNRCTFQDGSNTLEVIEGIFNDYKLNGKF